MKFCEKCGKEIADEAVICPGCGCAVGCKAYDSAQTNVVPKKAKNARIFGILAVVLLYPLGIPAIILAVQSKKETNGVMCGVAKAGLICGIIALVFWALAMIVFISNLNSAPSYSSPSYYSYY